jgi:hypothetical protein
MDRNAALAAGAKGVEMKKANLVSGIVLMISSLIFLIFIIPAQIEEVTEAIFSPRLMPYVCTWIILILSIFLIIQNISLLKGLTNPEDKHSPISKPEFRAMLVISGVLSVCIILFKFFGTLISAVVLVVSIMWLMGERRYLTYILLPGGLLLTTYLIFYKILGTTIR